MVNIRKPAVKGTITKFQMTIFFLISILLIINSCTEEKKTTGNKRTADEAVFLMEEGRYDSSIAIYRMLINQIDTIKGCFTLKKYRIAISDLYRQQGKFNLADGLLKSIDTSNCLNEDNRREYYFIRSKIDFDMRNYIPALSSIDKALEISERVYGRSSLQTAECFSLTGKCNLSINNYPEAKKYFDLSYSINKNVKADKKQFISDYMNYGMYYLALGDYDQALEKLNSGLNLIPAGADETFDLNKSSLLNGIGIVYYQLSDFEKALKNMNDALKIRERILSPSHYLTADIYGNLGMVYLGYAEPEIAYDLYERALNTRIKVFGEDNITVARTYNNLAGACKDLDKYDEAESYYLKALDAFGKLAPGNLSLGITMGNLGDVEAHNKNFSKSIDHFSESIKILKKYFGEFHPYTALTTDNLALAYSGMGNYREAVKYHNVAYQIAEKVYQGKSNILFSQILDELGQIRELQGDYEAALQFFQRSVSNMFPSVDANNYKRNPSENELKRDVVALEALSGKANALYELYKQKNDEQLLELSISTYDLVDKTIDIIRSGFKEESSKLLLSEKTHSIFDNAIKTFSEAYYKLHEKKWINKAFSYCEKSKAINLLETLIDIKAKDFGGLPDSLLQKEHHLLYRLSLLEADLYDEQSKGTVSEKSREMTITNSIFDLKKQYYSLLENFEKNYPKYYSLKYRLEPISPDSIQKKLLKNNEVIIEYFLGKDKLYIFTISNKEFTLKSVKLPDSVADIVDNFRKGLSNSEYGKYSVNSFKLYNLLIKPISDLIKNRNLIIISDGILNYIPFDALISLPPDLNNVDYRKLHYLIYDNKISYGYSASTLWENIIRDKSKESNTFVGFAPY